MAQLYVMIPGNAQPQLLEIDEILRRVRGGELPATANAARLGEQTWTPLCDLPEVSGPLARSPSMSGAEPGPGPSPIAATRQSHDLPPLGSQAGQPSPFAASPSGPGAAPLPSTAGSASPFAAGPSVGGGQPYGSQAGQPSPLFGAQPTAGGPAKPLNKGILIGAGGAFLVIVLGIVGVLYHRNSYSHGLVFEHVPDNCGELYYIDVQGIATSDPVKPHLEKLFKNAKSLSEDEIENKSKKDKERFTNALEALKKNGVDDQSVREIAVCIPTQDEDEKDKAKVSRIDEHGLLLIGGTWRKGDVLQGIKEAMEGATNSEDVCKIDEDDGLRVLKCSPDIKAGKKEPIYAALVDGRVLAITPDKKLLKSVRPSKDLSKKYEASKGENFVIWRSSVVPNWDGSYGFSKMKIGSSDTTLTIETHYDSEKGKKKLDQFKDPDELVKKKEKFLKDASSKCFEKSPLDMLGDGVDRAKVEAFDDGIKYEYKVANKDLSKAVKVLSDADKDDLKKIGALPTCVMFTVEPIAGY